MKQAVLGIYELHLRQFDFSGRREKTLLASTIQQSLVILCYRPNMPLCSPINSLFHGFRMHLDVYRYILKSPLHRVGYPAAVAIV